MGDTMPTDFYAEVPESLRGPQSGDCDCVYYGPPYDGTTKRTGKRYLGGSKGHGHQRIDMDCQICKGSGNSRTHNEAP